MRLLVTGGAGYIGSVVSRHLAGAGHDLVVFDSLEHGHRSAVLEEAEFIQGDLRDRAAIDAVLAAGGFDGVLHFAAYALVGESVADPGRYFANNVMGTLNLLEAMVAHDAPRLVFSSTCAVYGQPDANPIPESTPPRPVNPYGASKLAADHLIGGFCVAHGIGAVSLRYFNVAGAHAHVGEDHLPETHLVPNVLAVLLGRLEAVEVYGTDYPTPDGTAIRDYIHVDDLAAAHVLGLAGARAGEHRIFNLGNGNGFSVREVIAAAQRVTGRSIRSTDCPRRPGDPARLVASAELVRSELGWAPQKPAIDTMIAEAWEFHQRYPTGYGD